MEFKNKKLQSPRGSHSAKRRAHSENKTQKKEPYPSRGSHSAERRAHSENKMQKKEPYPSCPRDGAQSTYRPVIDCLLIGEGHPGSSHPTPTL
jgi:hypothetical protein